MVDSIVLPEMIGTNMVVRLVLVNSLEILNPTDIKTPEEDAGVV